MHRQEENLPHLWITALGLLVYCVFVTVLTGDIGFEGDDWWVLNVPYWNSFPYSLLVYAKEFLRPMEGVYWISMFEIFGFDRIVFQLFSLMLLAAASVLMGGALSKALPGRRVFVILAVLFAFFLPTVSSLTYIVFTDNSRLSLLLLWTAVLIYQRWAQRGASWGGLILPGLIYILSFLSYESAGFLLFTVPLFVVPVYCRKTNRWPEPIFFWKLGIGLGSAFAGVLCVRFIFLSGGAVSHSNFLPPWDLFWGYLALLPFYILAPFTSEWPKDPWVWVAGLGALLWVAVLVVVFGKKREAAESGGRFPWDSGSLYPAVMGIGILFLGMLPYQLAGYGAASNKLVTTVLVKMGLVHGNAGWFNFNEASRIYSSGSCGVAILLAVLATGWKRDWLLRTGKMAAAVVIGFMVIFHAGLSNDWKEAAEIRNDLMKSLVTQVPNVKPGTNFVFLDLESYHRRAAVFRGWAGLRGLIRMLYDDPNLGAWYVYPHAWLWPDQTFHQAIVFPSGFVSRGMDLDKPAASATLLIMKRSERTMLPLDSITPRDGTVPTGIDWRGANALNANHERIVAWADTELTPRRMRNAWSTGLISTLQLARFNTKLKLVNKWAGKLRFKLKYNLYFRLGLKRATISR
ncbi:MAG TPA: hypothetical protein VK463_18800 [Desulfomonilaceae bacterium]|nr:hypothetical protein [Desulfomonilaceae bacterium]